jgi:hypothetical protein
MRFKAVSPRSRPHAQQPDRLHDVEAQSVDADGTRHPPRVDFVPEFRPLAQRAWGVIQGGSSMGLWLLSFTGRCNAAVVRGESLIQARLLAVADGIGRASHFDEGFAIDPEQAGQIPPSLIGRQLSGDEAADLLTMLMIASPDSPIVATAALAN